MTVLSFSIENRTITGVLMPIGYAAFKGGHHWRFARNSCELAANAPVNLYHDRKQRVGRRVASEETDVGFTATFKIDEGEAGDTALQDAADGLLSFSVEISNPQYTDKGGARMVKKVVVDEVGLTPVPAFAGAGVSSVVFDGLPEVPVTPPALITPVAPAPVVFDQEAFRTAFAAEMERINAAGQGPEIVPIGSGLVVNEEPQYRFDNLGGTHDFSTDLITGLKFQDREASDRVMSFIKEQFAVVQSGVASLNPSQNRPGMYVDQMDYQFPLWNAVRKGGLTNNTPFFFPKFNTSSGLVANHTEGVEPTPGAFSTTNQTVTPSAVSGKVEITREVWDQGGNPAVSGLIWRQMVRAWYEALEAYVVALFEANAASITDIALGAGPPTGTVVNTVLDAAITDAFASLQYVRGGFNFSDFAVQIDLYKKLASAVDSAGRHLYPMIAPQNANGTAANLFRTMNVNGVTAYPAWALAATGSVVANSWLFDPEKVHAWASTPERLEFQYRVAYVDLAIYGYKAAAISDLNGVRQITYDPA